MIRPIVYRDGIVRVGILGPNDAIQAAVRQFPGGLSLEAEDIGEYDTEGTLLDGLTNRQREALRIGIDVGFYERPRKATHEDIADRLGCFPSTASEHLRTAEAKLVRSLFKEN